jgi:hypothetical protein
MKNRVLQCYKIFSVAQHNKVWRLARERHGQGPRAPPWRPRMVNEARFAFAPWCLHYCGWGEGLPRQMMRIILLTTSPPFWRQPVEYADGTCPFSCNYACGVWSPGTLLQWISSDFPPALVWTGGWSSMPWPGTYFLPTVRPWQKQAERGKTHVCL